MRKTQIVNAFEIDTILQAAFKAHSPVDYLIRTRNKTFKFEDPTRSTTANPSPTAKIRKVFFKKGDSLSKISSSKSIKFKQSKKQLISRVQIKSRNLLQSKKLIKRMKIQRQFETDAQNITLRDSINLHNSSLFHMFKRKASILLKRLLKDVLDSSVFHNLDLFLRLIDSEVNLQFLANRLLKLVGECYLRVFQYEKGIKLLLRCQLFSRTKQDFQLAIEVQLLLANTYIGKALFSQAKQKYLNLLYLAVYLRKEDLQMLALQKISLCYFYMDELQVSRLYYQHSQVGLSPVVRVEMQKSFDNASRIQELEEKLGIFNDRIYKKFQIFKQTQPILKSNGSDLPLNRMEESKKSVLFLMHRTTNRNWQNYFSKEDLQAQRCFVPKDKQLWSRFRATVQYGLKLLAQIQDRIQQPLSKTSLYIRDK